jgi:diacylglycerol kinase family enzyme
VVPDVTLRRIVRHGWRLMAGSIGRVPGVRIGRAREVDVAPEARCLLHLDGETQQVTGMVRCAVRERALQVRVPD